MKPLKNFLIPINESGYNDSFTIYNGERSITQKVKVVVEFSVTIDNNTYEKKLKKSDFPKNTNIAEYLKSVEHACELSFIFYIDNSELCDLTIILDSNNSIVDIEYDYKDETIFKMFDMKFMIDSIQTCVNSIYEKIDIDTDLTHDVKLYKRLTKELKAYFKK